MVSPLVSVCIPCRNAAPYLASSLDSILSQTWPNIEIIVVDDGSTDGSAELLRTYSGLGVCCLFESFGSASKSRNRAFSVSQGSFVKFFDADDLLHPRTIELQVNRLIGRDDAVASSSWGRFYGHDLSTFRLSRSNPELDLASIDWLVSAWRYAQPMMQAGMFLIPRGLLERSGGWDESLSLIDDFEFFARLFCCASDLLFVPDAILYYRSGIPGSLSSRKSRRDAESAFHSLLKGTSHLLLLRNDSSARLSCANMLQLFVYDVYPDFPDLRAIVNARVRELGGSDLPVPGGPRWQMLRRLLGWKVAMRLKKLMVAA